MTYIRVWRRLVINSFSAFASNRLDSFSYLAGKLIRFGFFWLFIVSIFHFTDTLAGYNKYEVLLFFLTFNLVDVLSQVLFRGIYMFKSAVNRGKFDFTLTKPINPLFYSLSRLTDLMDLIFLGPIIGLLIYVIVKLPISLSIAPIAIYFATLFLALILTLSIHIISAAVTIITIESDQVIWFYRESMTLGRFPMDVYSQTVQLIFTFIMPIFIIVAFPARALLGLVTKPLFAAAILVTLVFFLFSLIIWQYALRQYSSASS